MESLSSDVTKFAGILESFYLDQYVHIISQPTCRVFTLMLWFTRRGGVGWGDVLSVCYQVRSGISRVSFLTGADNTWGLSNFIVPKGYRVKNRGIKISRKANTPYDFLKASESTICSSENDACRLLMLSELSLSTPGKLAL